jgi:hypothetical protein
MDNSLNKKYSELLDHSERQSDENILRNQTSLQSIPYSTSIEIHQWPSDKTSTQPVEIPLDTNFWTRIKSVRPIRIQKEAPWVESWWTPVERELIVNTDAVEFNQIQEIFKSQQIWKPSATSKEFCKYQQICKRLENQVS